MGSEGKFSTWLESRSSFNCFHIPTLPRTNDTTLLMLLAEATGRGKGEQGYFLDLAKPLKRKWVPQTFHICTQSLRWYSASVTEFTHKKLLVAHTSKAASLSTSEMQNKRLHWTLHGENDVPFLIWFCKGWAKFLTFKNIARGRHWPRSILAWIAEL